MNRAHGRLAGADSVELDNHQREAARDQVHHIQSQLRRIDEKILSEPEADVILTSSMAVVPLGPRNGSPSRFAAVGPLQKMQPCLGNSAPCRSGRLHAKSSMSHFASLIPSLSEPRVYI